MDTEGFLKIVRTRRGSETKLTESANDLISSLRDKLSLVEFAGNVVKSCPIKINSSILEDVAQNVFKSPTSSDITVLEFLAVISGLSQIVNERLLDPIIDEAYVLLEADRISLFKYEEDQDKLKCLVSKDIEGAMMPASAGLIGHSFRTKQLVNCEDVSADERHYHHFDEKFEPKSMLCAPIFLNEKPVGVLASMRQGQAFSQVHESQMLQIVPKIAEILQLLSGTCIQEVTAEQPADRVVESLLSKLAPLELSPKVDDHSKALVSDARRLLTTLKGDLVCPSPRSMAVSPSDVFTSGFTQAELFSWDFDALKVDVSQLRSAMGNMLSAMFDFDELRIDHQVLAAYLTQVEEKYNDNPFHNFRHSVTVSHVACMLSGPMKARQKLGILQHFAVIFSAVVHDIDHPGNTNVFELNARTDRAMFYNDQSVLENHHCATAFRLMDRPGLNVMGGMTPSERRDFRKVVISCILATDMSTHFQLLDEFSKKVADGPWLVDNPADQLLLGKFLVHAADLSNPVRSFDMTRRWAESISEEFNQQVEKEKAMGLPVLPFMVISDDIAMAKNEMNFCTFVLSPMWRIAASQFPELGHLTEQLDQNFLSWKEIADAGAGTTGSAFATPRVKSLSAGGVDTDKSS